MFLTFWNVFDIFKIEPVRYIDKNLKHGAGVILDDVVAGLYAGIVYRVIQLFEILPWKFSLMKLEALKFLTLT